MAIINRVIPPFNGTMQTERPYVDDIFDPLFNKAVTDYYSGMYGNRVVGTLAGYADMWDNALTGREGILGPGMGFLSTFGRSMDKADDFILGGLTEGVNWLGQRLGGTNPDPVNPIKNIMVNDYDYQGTRLMAAAGNAMAKLAGTQTPLDETDFSSFGDRMAGTAIDLITDPGILGGRLATLKAGTPIGDVGHALDSYDNFMAKVASNTALPGAKHLASKGIHQIRKLVDASSYKDLVDVNLEGSPYYTGDAKPIDGGLADLQMYSDMADDYAKAAGINPIDNPEEFNMVQYIKSKGVKPVLNKNNPIHMDVTKTYVNNLPTNIDKLVEHRLHSDEAIYKNLQEGVKSGIVPKRLQGTIIPEDETELTRAIYDLWDSQDDNGRIFNNATRDYVLAEDVLTEGLNRVKNFMETKDPLEIKDFIEQYPILKQSLPSSNTTLSSVQPYKLSSSTARLRKELGAENMAEIMNVTKNFIQKYPDNFKDINSFYDLSDAMKENIKAYLTGNVFTTKNLKDTLESDIYTSILNLQAQKNKGYKFNEAHFSNKDYGILSTLSGALSTPRTLKEIYENPKLIFEDDTYKRFIDLQDYLKKYPDTALKDLDIVLQASQNDNLRVLLEDLTLNRKNLPGLTKAFKDFDFRVSKKLHDTSDKNLGMSMDDFFNSLNKYETEIVDGIEVKKAKGLIPTIQEYASKLAGTPFGDDLLNWTEDVKKLVDNVTYKEDPLASLTRQIDTSAFGDTVSGYNKLVNTMPDVDVKLNTNSKLIVDSTPTPQSKLLKRVYDDFNTYKSNIAKAEKTLTDKHYVKTKDGGLVSVDSFLDYIKKYRLSNDLYRIPTTLKEVIDDVTKIHKSHNLTYKAHINEAMKSADVNVDALLDNVYKEYPYFNIPTEEVVKSLISRAKRVTSNAKNLVGGRLAARNAGMIVFDDVNFKTTLSAAEYNALIKGNEHNHFLKSLFQDMGAKGIYNSKADIDKGLLHEIDFNLDLHPNKKGFALLHGLETVNGKTYIKSNDTLGVFTNRVNDVDFRKQRVKYAINSDIVDVMDDVSADFVNGITAPKKIKTLKTNLKQLDTPEFVRIVTSNNSKTDILLDKFKNNIAIDISQRYGGIDFDNTDVAKFIKEYGNREDFTLFKYIRKLEDSRLGVKARQKTVINTHPALRKLRDTAKRLKSKYTEQQYAEYAKLTSELEDQVIKGEDMIKYLIGSGGHVQVSGVSKEFAANLLKTIDNNIAQINSKHKILESFTIKDTNGYTVGYRFVVDPNIKKYVSDYYSIFNSRARKQHNLSDMVFYKGNPKNMDVIRKKYAELDDFFSEVRNVSQDLSTRLGFTKFNDNYIKTAMLEDDSAQLFFGGLAKSTGTRLKDLNKISKAVGNLDLAERGAFGAVNLNKAYLGSFDNYSQGYSKDIEEVFTSTFTKGMMDNTNAQTFFDLFLSGNNSVRQNFRDLDTLKKALFATDSKGNLAGNLDNLEIVAPKYNSDGKLVGFKRYNKFSDLDLKAAFDAEDAVLLPKTIISPLDRMLKKDIRMSNKVYQFINKYVTVPFKFGILSNPGFLVGNMGDAYFKQAVTMANKYGTNIEDELVQVAMSANELTILNNKFTGKDGIFDKYCQFLTTEPILDPIFKKSKTYAKNKLLSPDLLINNPEFLKAWTFYLNNTLKSGPDREIAKLYTFLNIRQNTALFKNNNLDLSDVFDKNFQNEYDIPTNRIEKAMYGLPSKDRLSEPGTWGLFMGNPLSDFILKQSNQMEAFMRSTSILNDLKHKGYTQERMSRLLEIPTDESIKLRNELKIKMLDATNTMHASNFDYDAVGGIVDEVSYIMPFPTFYLKNMEYWITVMSEHPEMLDDIISVHEGMWSAKQEDVENDEFAAEAKGRGAVPIMTGKGRLSSFVKQTPYSSMFGAFNSLNDPANDFAFRTNPLLKPVTRHLQDPEEVRYRPYSTDLYEKNINANDKNFSELAYLFHQLNPYDKFIGNTLRTVPKIDQGQLRLSDFAPSILQPDF